jgi:SAM-dependent methyltransferase
MTEIQVPPEHYDWSTYNIKGRWVSYWHQVTEVVSAGATSVLEIGTGTGTVRDTLRNLGIAVTVVDIDAALGVDRVGDVRSLPAADGEFDVVLCSQVLEHVPWDDVPQAVAELRRVCRTHAIVSIPQSGVDVGVTVTLPQLGTRRLAARINSPWRHRFDGQHYWQVCARGHGRRVVRDTLSEGFALEREFTVPELTFHRFYVLRKP